MADESEQFQIALAAALQLSVADRLRLIAQVASALERDIAAAEKKPLKTFEGVLAHLGSGPSDEDIADVRRDMLKNFPREDFQA